MSDSRKEREEVDKGGENGGKCTGHQVNRVEDREEGVKGKKWVEMESAGLPLAVTRGLYSEEP